MNKKLILGLGTIATSALPVTAIVACGSKDKKATPEQKDKKIKTKNSKRDNNKENNNSLVDQRAKALQEAKDVAKDLIKKLPYPQQDSFHNAVLFSKIAQAKQAALTSIENATTPQLVKALASSTTQGPELLKVQATIDAYNNLKEGKTIKTDKPTEATKQTESEVKDAVVIPVSPKNVASTVLGSNNTYTLAYSNTDSESQEALEEALKGMVKKASGNKSRTVTFKGTWKPDFNRTKDGTYVYTVIAKGYNNISFAIKVTGNTNTKIDGKITLVGFPLLKGYSVVTQENNYEATIPFGTIVTIDDIKELFKGSQGNLEVSYGERCFTNFFKQPGHHTFNVEAKGLNKGTNDSKSLIVTVTPPQVKIKPIHFNDRGTKEQIQDYLTSGLDSNIRAYAPLDISEVTKSDLADPNSVASFNYAGAIGIINAIYKNTLGSNLDNDMNKGALKNIQAILKALLLDQTILENKVGQNLNSQEVAQSFFKELDSKGIEALASLGTLDSKVLVFKKRNQTNQNQEEQNVSFKLEESNNNIKVTLSAVGSNQ